MDVRSFLAWAESRHLGDPAKLLIEALQAQSAPVDVLETALVRIGRVAPHLQRWSGQGADVYGLGLLAAALPELEGADIYVANTANAFRRCASTHYLYMSWVAHDPQDSALGNWIDTYRAWVLVHAIQRATLSKPVVIDEFLREACLRSRLACEATTDTLWPEAFRQIETSAVDWYQLQRHFRELDSESINDRPIVREWVRTLGQIARNQTKAAKENDGCVAAYFGWASRDQHAQDEPDHQPHTPEEGVWDVQPEILFDDPEEDEEAGHDWVRTEADEGLASQAQSARYLQLLSGADARFLTWDWNTATPPEREALDKHIAISLRPDSPPVDRLMGAMVSTAVALGRSLEMTGRMRLAPQGASGNSREWVIDAHARSARRAAPRRAGHWKPSPSLPQACLRPAHDTLQIALPDAACAVFLEELRTHSRATTLDQLWQGVHPSERATTYFLRWRAKEPRLRRVTQGMLAQSMARNVLRRSNDHVLARLLSSTPTSGLPAASAYTAYLAGDVALAVSLTGQSLPAPGSEGPNLAGGLLDPVESYLCEGFKKTVTELDVLRNGPNLVAFHNALTHYWDAAWRAATGIRPYSGRWTDASHVDEAHEFVVVEDKLALQEAKARLIPLPRGFWTTFRDAYLDRHLSNLRRCLAARGVGDLDHLRSSSNSLGQPKPLLFILKEAGDSLLMEPVGAHAPLLRPEQLLPANVYRHRLRTALHRLGVDTEIIDAVLGHQDGATATHGDHSSRVWLSDAQTVVQPLTDVYERLHIRIPAAYCGDASAVAARRVLPLARSSGPLNTKEQGSGHWKLSLRAARSAREILSDKLRQAEHLLSERPRLKTLIEALAKLDGKDVDDVSKKLMRTTKGTPSTLGPLRYAFFLRLIDRVWERTGQRVRRQRGYFARIQDKSPFSATAAGATQQREALCTSLDRAASARRRALTRSEAMWLAQLDLLLTSRVADPELQRLLLEGKPFRVIQFRKQPYLEWNAAGNVDNLLTPVQRVRIKFRTADALQRIAQSAQPFAGEGSTPPGRFESLANIALASQPTAPRNLASVLAAVSAVVAQSNAIEFPGTVAALLSGRLRCASLPWGDWLALRGHPRPDARHLALEPTVTADSDRARSPFFRIVQAMPQQARTHGAAPGSIAVHPGHGLDSIDRQRQGRQLFREVRRVLAAAHQASLSSKKQSDYRRAAHRELTRLAQSAPSSAVGALVSWCASLFDRKLSGSLLRVPTILRYFSALSPRFEAIACDQDLLALEVEDIEDLYADLIELRDKSSSAYPCSRLREFHAYGQRHLGLPSIDWSEITPDADPVLCWPGYVDEGMFRELLAAIQHHPELATSETRLAARALLVLAYRFGLRGGEALGLQLDDLYLDDSPPWIAIRKNGLRHLKSLAARRTVPLFHKVREDELDALRSVADIARQSGRESGGSTPLFVDSERPPALLDTDGLKRTLNQLIKEMSGTQHLSLHHLRHSFACQLWHSLEGTLRLGEGMAMVMDTTSAARRDDRLFDASERPTRRSPWILARAMGHAHVRTTFVNYVHLLDEAAEALAFSKQTSDWSRPKGAIPALEALPRLRAPEFRAPPARPQLTAMQMWRILLDLDQGVEPPVITQRYAAVSLELAHHIHGIYHGALGKAARRTPSSNPSWGLMRHVSEAREPQLKARLSSLYEADARSRFAEIGITPDEFCSMFGSRRNISMFRRAQFELVRLVVEILDVPSMSLRIGAPHILSEELRALAVATGWLRDPLTQTAPSGLSLELQTGLEIDATTFLGHAVRDRLVLSLEPQSGPLASRWHLIVALMMAIPLVRFEAERL